MKTKRIALLLSALLVFSLFLTACGGGSSPAPEASPNEDVTPSGSDNTDSSPQGGSQLAPKPAGAIDFTDGNIDYAAMNLKPGGADPSDLSIIDFNGGKALKVTIAENGKPYLGIDVSSMFGDKVGDIRTIELRVFTERSDGEFYAVSGSFYTYTGSENTETQFIWGVSMEKNNPKTITAELPDGTAFVPGAKNIVVLHRNDDNAVMRAAKDASNLIIDYIAFYDAAGNAMQPDTTVLFDAPAGFGASDRSLLFEVTDEVRLEFRDDGATGASAGDWKEAGKIDSIDFSLLKEGCIITVGYKSAKAPELVFQSWTGGEGWAKVAPFMTNLSGNLAQFRYEDIVAAYGENFEDTLNRINITDRGTELEIKSVSIGQRASDIGYRSVLVGDDEFIDITDLNCIEGDWTPFKSLSSWKLNYRANTTNIPESGDPPGDFNPKWLVEGSYITVNYASAEGTQFCFQRYPTETTGQAWSSLDPDKDPGGFTDPAIGIDQITYEGIMSVWEYGGGGEDFYGELNAVWIQNRNQPMDVFKIILYTPNPTGE